MALNSYPLTGRQASWQGGWLVDAREKFDGLWRENASTKVHVHEAHAVRRTCIYVYGTLKSFFLLIWRVRLCFGVLFRLQNPHLTEASLMHCDK